MGIIQTKDLQPGMVVAAPVKTRSGQLIVSEGVELDEKLIGRLFFYSVKSVNIANYEPEPEPEEEETVQEEQAQTDIEEPIEEPIKESVEEPTEDEPQEEETPGEESDETEEESSVDTSRFIDAGRASYAQKIKRGDKFKGFQVGYTQSVVQLKQAFEELTKKSVLDASALLSSSLQILNDQKLNTIEFFDMIHNLRQDRDSIYSHCLNVAFISRVLGKWMKMDKDTINDLTLAGLLHDIGKTMVPATILEKPGKLTDSEYEVVKMHPQFGYELIKNLDIPTRVKTAVLNHHERCDNSGYPNHLGSDALDDFTMVIAIADVYDAMTAARAHRRPLCPFTVISNFEDDGLQKFKPHVILTFLERIANTYQNNRVLLSNGTQGTIVLLNNSHLSRPILRLDNGEFLDLTTEPSLQIVSII